MGWNGGLDMSLKKENDFYFNSAFKRQFQTEETEFAPGE